MSTFAFTDPIALASYTTRRTISTPSSTSPSPLHPPTHPCRSSPPTTPMNPKTYPTKSAGPHFLTSRPIHSPLLRIIPGDPRFATPPLHFLSDTFLPIPDSHTLTLHATVADQTAAIVLPLPSPNPIPVQWFDFSLIQLSASFLELSLTKTDHDRSETSLIARAVLLAPDFSHRKGILNPVLLDSAGVPVVRLTLDFLVITPPPPGAPPLSVQNGIPRFTGHRGLGKSGPTHPTRILENDPESFLLAALLDSKVNTVELDVQLSRDGRTVVYHDWFFRFDGTRDSDPHRSPVKVPIYNLTFDQCDTIFRSLNNKDSYYTSESRSILRDVVAARDDISEEVFDTKMWSLKDLCQALPDDIGLLVELKYPAPNIQEDEMVPAPEKNFFVDCVLRDLFEVHGNQKREIGFLSFDADLATLLAHKQTLYPVYLSHCENIDKPCDEFDPRCIDLDEGLRFASSQKLDGMMLFNELVQLKPDTIQRIRDRGLSIITYGRRNSEPEFVEHQFRLGVGGVIADDVNELAASFQT